MMKSTQILKAIILVASFLIVLLVSACSSAPPAPTAAEAIPTASATPAPEITSEPAADSSGSIPDEVAAAVAERTPVPTPTPSVVDQQINELTTSLGLAGKTFLGLTANDWFSLAFSVLIVIVGYFLGFKVLVWFIKWIAHRTSRDFDGSALKEIAPDLKLLLLVFFTRFAVLRLEFLSLGLRTALDDVFFVIALVLISIIAIRLINLSLDRYVVSTHRVDDPEKLDRVIKFIQRLGDIAVLIITGSIAMSHFGIGTSALAIALILFGLIIYLGARGVIADFVAGFIIMADQPFRVDDAILIKELDTWGVVIDIGTRTTRIRTRDNREVIIPNSQINESLVINYTYPDSKYRLTTDIGVAYGTDIEQMRNVIESAVRGIEGVLPDKPVDVFFLEYGDSARLVRVRWWIDSYKKDYQMRDKVNAAIETALSQAGIEMPFDTYDLNVKLQGEIPSQEQKDAAEDSN